MVGAYHRFTVRQIVDASGGSPLPASGASATLVRMYRQALCNRWHRGGGGGGARANHRLGLLSAVDDDDLKVTDRMAFTLEAVI